MTWQALTLWRWWCDGCEYVATFSTDDQPFGWTHTQDGRDLCYRCSA